MIAEIRDITQIIFNLIGIGLFLFVAFAFFISCCERVRSAFRNAVEKIIDEKKQKDEEMDMFDDFDDDEYIKSIYKKR